MSDSPPLKSLKHDSDGAAAARQDEDDDDDALEEEEEETESTAAKKFFEPSDASLFIVHYAADIPPGIRGDFKSIPEDFVVSELDQRGNVVTLRERVKKAAPVAAPSTDDVASSVDALVKALGLDEAVAHRMASLCSGDKATPTVNLPSMDDKGARSRAHALIREHVGRWAVSTTQAGNVIQVARANASKRKEDTRRLGQAPPPFLHLTLMKRDMDLNHAISELARKSRTPRKSFTFAGTKDKLAVTFQRIAVFRGNPERLAGVCDTSQPQHFLVGDPSYHDAGLFLGDARGNHFCVVLRNLEAAGVDVDAAVRAWGARGFLNYYGKQRFGTNAVGTHAVGRALIAREWAEAVDLLLQPREGEPAYLDALRREYAVSKDAAALLARLPKRCTGERAVCEGLAKHMAPLNALDLLPRNLRSIYMHAFQSRVWNEIASRRFEAYGANKVVPGDLVLVDGASSDASELARDCRVRLVVSDDDARALSIADVVLPLPGTAVVYPRAAAIDKSAYEAALQRAGVSSLELLRNTAQKAYALAGGYRRFIEVPGNVRYRILQCAAGDQTVLIEPGRPVAEARSEGEGARALALSFTLKAGCYATMALRELCR